MKASPIRMTLALALIAITTTACMDEAGHAAASAPASDCAEGERCEDTTDTTDTTDTAPREGMDGRDGRDGEDGSSCTIEEIDQETVLVCEDGTSAVLERDGEATLVTTQTEVIEVGSRECEAGGVRTLFFQGERDVPFFTHVSCDTPAPSCQPGYTANSEGSCYPTRSARHQGVLSRVEGAEHLPAFLTPREGIENFIPGTPSPAITCKVDLTYPPARSADAFDAGQQASWAYGHVGVYGIDFQFLDISLGQEHFIPSAPTSITTYHRVDDQTADGSLLKSVTRSEHLVHGLDDDVFVIRNEITLSGVIYDALVPELLHFFTDQSSFDRWADMEQVSMSSLVTIMSQSTGETTTMGCSIERIDVLLAP